MHAPGVTDGQKMIYMPAATEEGSRLAAVDITRQVGPVKWEVLARGPITAAPAMYENVVYFGSQDHRVYAVTTSRQPVWPLDQFSFETDGEIKAAVKADGFAVYAASTDTKLYALDRLSGKIKWTYFAESALSTPPTPTEDTVYQYAPGKGLVAIDKTEGRVDREPKWVAADAVQVLSVGQKRVYVRLSDDTIGAVDKQTGDLLWREPKRYAKFTTNLQDATIFVATEGGEVYAYQPVGEAAPARPAAAPGAAPKASSGPAATGMTAPAAAPRPMTAP
jgi:outer membrane protein assembly factor BamB